MIWKCGTVILCCLIGFTPSVQKKPLAEPTGRKASQFDTAGPFTIGNDLTRTQQAKVAAEAKEFIWSHWIGRRRGKVNVIAYTIEGNRSSTTFFVEPDEKGRWRVRADSETNLVALVKQPRTETRVECYYDVARIDLKSWKPILQSEKRDATTYALRFINRRKNIQWDY